MRSQFERAFPGSRPPDGGTDFAVVDVMNSTRSIAFSSALFVLLACGGEDGAQGPAGPQGDPGPAGQVGPQGDPGPILSPPRIASLAPAWGSAFTSVVIHGENFDPTAANNRVTFDGFTANVSSASATQLVVAPGIAPDGPTELIVSVEVRNQVSNGVAFELVPSGTARTRAFDLPTAPTSAVEVGGELYVAAGTPVLESAGLFRVEAGGRTTRVVGSQVIELGGGGGGGGPSQLVDGPVAVATDGTDVLFTTAFGAVRRYNVATGSVEDVLAPVLGGGNAFPGRTGLVFDGNGNLFVVDRNLQGTGGVIAVATDGSITEIVDGAFAGSGEPGIFGIATDGTELFVTNESTDDVVRIADPLGTPIVSPGFATNTSRPTGISVVGTDLVVSVATGELLSVDSGTGGAAVLFGSVSGYAYPATGLSTTAGGDLLLAQPSASAVRRIASGGSDAEIVSAGVRVAFGTELIGDALYLAAIGPGLFGGDPTLVPDSVVIELAADRSTRVVANGSFFTGMTTDGSGGLIVSDCVEQQISALDVATGALTPLVDAGDGLTCPAGLHREANGDLYYVNTNLGGGSATVGRLQGGTVTVDFITALPSGSVFLTEAAGSLLVSPFGELTLDGFDIVSAPLTTGGAATLLVDGATAGGLAGMSTAPDGRVFAIRFGLGEIVEIDPASGALSSFGSSLAGPFLGGNGGGAGSFSLAFEADGTFLIADFGQNSVVAVAP